MTRVFLSSVARFASFDYSGPMFKQVYATRGQETGANEGLVKYYMDYLPLCNSRN